eukprot:2386270-Pleurochrysis_carterae.AAC.3
MRTETRTHAGTRAALPPTRPYLPVTPHRTESAWGCRLRARRRSLSCSAIPTSQASERACFFGPHHEARSERENASR